MYTASMRMVLKDGVTIRRDQLVVQVCTDNLTMIQRAKR